MPEICIDAARCVQSANCVRVCPMGVFDLVAGRPKVSRPERCVCCNLCTQNCPVNCITVTPVPVAPGVVAGTSPAPSRAPLGPVPLVERRGAEPMSVPMAPSVSYGASSSPAAIPASPPPAMSAISNQLGGMPRPISAPTRPPVIPYMPLLTPPHIEKGTVTPPVVLAPTPVLPKRLVALQGVCVNCRLCELACSLSHTGVNNPYQSRVRVTGIREKGIWEPVICHHCQPAPCEQACPTKALFQNPGLAGVVILNPSKCIKCHECVNACPFGAIQVSPSGDILKCDLCGGNPACVAVCQDRPEFRPPQWKGRRVSALQYVDHQEVTFFKRLFNVAGPK